MSNSVSGFEAAVSQAAVTRAPAGETPTVASRPLAESALASEEVPWEADARSGLGSRGEARVAREGGACPAPLRGGAGAEPPSTAPPGAVPFLDTFNTTRPGEEGSAPSTTENVWLEQVGDLTHEHRQTRARELVARATARAVEMRRAGWSEESINQGKRWHHARARGQRERIANVRECGGSILRVSCRACGVVHEHANGCRVGILCVSCRGAIAATKRAGFQRARADVLEESRYLGLLRPVRRGGRYSEKFLTLTGPHLSGDTISVRITRIAEAWCHWLKRLNRYLRDNVICSVEWFRVLEWTPGRDGLGHPHLHVWLFSPFLEVETVREWWRLSLVEAGCELDHVRRPIVDLRQIEGSDGGARELIKYLTKDITANGDKVPAELYAEVYKAFDGRRISQASRGFMARGKKEPRACECGATLPPRVERRRRETGEEPPQ